LKNYLFSRVPSQQDLDALARRWHKLVTTVRQEKFPEFLRYHLLCEEPKIRQQRLFKLVRDRVKTSADVFDLLERLENRAELFAAISDPDHDYWKDRVGARPHIQALKLFAVRQHTPALFAAWEKFSGNEFERLLRLIENFAFRYTVIGGLNPNDLETAYHLVAKGILSGDFLTATQAFQPLEHLNPTDDKFERDFAEAALKTGGARQKVVRYVLFKLESKLSGVSRDWTADPGTIEHVLPENPSEVWSALVPEDKQAAYTYRLGNLAILERRRNRDAANKGFDEKRAIYAGSEYQTTRAIDEFSPEEWTAAAIEARQSKMAEHAVMIWRNN
ncbi:MAG TPA: HNH endonuclease family protein, partial [Pyrinomonadaceae bacterium]